MTEKTPKTSHPDQTGDSSKKKQTVATDGDTAVTDATDAKASTQGKSAASSGTGSASKPAKASSPQGDPVSQKKAASGSAKDPGDKTPPVAPSATERKKSSAVPVALSILALVLVGVLWYQHTLSQGAITQLESQSRTSADQARVAAQQAEQALAALRQQDRKVDALATELRESKSQFDSLNDAFQRITDRGSDLVLLNDVDHLVVIAQQQLQLSGNVANAIISLETAQAQLARANRPGLASLQQTINGDLDRLRAAKTVDIALLSHRLDELASLVTQAPLLVPDDAVPGATEPQQDDALVTPPSQTADVDTFDDVWWKNALARTRQWSVHTWASLRHDLGQFISVRRVDDATALLISPDQATRFRDNLRLRIMTAQLALMMDQPQIWVTETEALVVAIQSRFDPTSALTRRALKISRDVADTAIDTPLPDVTNSIKALEAVREQTDGRPSSEPPVAGSDDLSTESAPENRNDDSVITPSGAGAPDADRPAAKIDDAQPAGVDKQPEIQG